MMSPSGTVLPPQGEITQVLKITNPSRVSYFSHTLNYPNSVQVPITIQANPYIVFPERPSTKNTSIIQRGRRASVRASRSEQLPAGPVQLTSGQPARLLSIACASL